jgi:hypothetical protein
VPSETSSGPSPAEGRLPLLGAPLPLTRTLSTAWRVYRRRAGALIALFVAVHLLVSGVQTAVFSLLGVGRGEVGTSDVLAAIFSQVVLPPLLGSLATALAAVLLRDALTNGRAGVRRAAATLRPQWRELAASALVAAMLSLAFVVPPLSLLAPLLGLTYFGLLYGPPILMHVIALEVRPLQAAWPRTRLLLKGNWSRLLLYLLSVTFVISLLAGLVTLPAGAFSSAATSIVYAIVLGALISFLSAVVFVAYLDLREQKDAAGDQVPPTGG